MKRTLANTDILESQPEFSNGADVKAKIERDSCITKEEEEDGEG